MNKIILVCIAAVLIVATVLSTNFSGMIVYGADENGFLKIGTFAVCGEKDGQKYCEDSCLPHATAI